MTIKKKLILYSYLIMTPLLVFISAMMFRANYKAAIQAEHDSCLQSVQTLSDSVESMQKNVMEMGTYITINNDINRIMTVDDPEELNMDGQLWVHYAPMQIIQDMIAINGQIKTISIYPENGVMPYLRCMDSAANLSDFSVVRETEIYKEAVGNGGTYLWQRVGKGRGDTYSTNRYEKIVMYREIYDLSKKNRLGYLTIGSAAEKFDEVCRNSLRNQDEEVVVVSANGAELVRVGVLDDELVTEILGSEQVRTGESTHQNAGQNTSQGELSLEGGYEGYTVYCCTRKSTGTSVYKIVPTAGIRDVFASVIAGPMALLFGFLVGLLPIMLLLSNIISKPLTALCQAMRKFKKGDFDQKVEVCSEDEVGEVSAVFNEMVEDMKKLIDRNYVMALKEKESELDALQAQINPHFLYNALDSLYWQATEAENEEIAEDILALSELFRMVLNRGEGIVTVRNECELLDRYLHIQKMRFGKRLSYEIRINSDMEEEEIPKLILQPFVENAIVHGFEKGTDNFKLTILGAREHDTMTFWISDTGVGMSAAQREAIWQQEDNRKYAGQRIGHYAIKNVKERLELTYQDQFRLEIYSEEGKGTDVMIQIPVKKFR